MNHIFLICRTYIFLLIFKYVYTDEKQEKLGKGDKFSEWFPHNYFLWHLRQIVHGLLIVACVLICVTIGHKADPRKHVLFMDEVDGMAGNEDRGGMQVRKLTLYNCSIN